MKQLAEMLVGLGCQNVQTYIQSGNVLLQDVEGTFLADDLIPDTLLTLLTRMFK
jgi:uncharacterized protein (DUF1697 family)